MRVIQQYTEVLDDINPDAIMKKIELCGRVAYKSEDKITAGSAERFVRMLIRRGHESVLEHVSISVRFVCDRGISHEIVRHRLCAFTQESTRYCNYAQKGIAVISPFSPAQEGTDLYAAWEQAVKSCEDTYTDMISGKVPPELARSILPTCLKTELILTANLREWRHIFRLRTSKDAHPQMRQLMIPLLEGLKVTLPAIFDDIKPEPTAQAVQQSIFTQDAAKR